jgi:hypothetical protein
MDRAKFDGLARRLSTEQSRRSALRVAGVGLVAGLVPGLAPAEDMNAAPLSGEACLPIGTKCGGRRKGSQKVRKATRRRQPTCRKCCSGNTSRSRNGQPRCACIQDLRQCRRPDQCCSGVCLSARELCPDGISCGPFPGLAGNDKYCIPGYYNIGISAEG